MPEPSEDPTTVARLLRSRLGAGPIELPVAGQSMAGVIASGSIATVERAAAPRRGEIWLFVDDAATLTVHRVRLIAEHTVTGRGTGNPRDDAPVPIDRLVGRVRQVTDAEGSVQHFGPLDRLTSDVMFRLRRSARAFGIRRRGE